MLCAKQQQQPTFVLIDFNLCVSWGQGELFIHVLYIDISYRHIDITFEHYVCTLGYNTLQIKFLIFMILTFSIPTISGITLKLPSCGTRQLVHQSQAFNISLTMSF